MTLVWTCAQYGYCAATRGEGFRFALYVASLISGPFGLE